MDHKMCIEPMFTSHFVCNVLKKQDLQEKDLNDETRNVLALNDAAAEVGEDRFFYFSDPHENKYAPSLFITKAGYGPVIAYEKWTWSEEEKAEYWKHGEAERYCMMQSELSRVKLDDRIMPLLLFIPDDEKNHVSWPNDTIAKAFMGIIDNQIHLARRVDWEHVALICGRRCELYFHTDMDPPADETGESDPDSFPAARNALTARGKSIIQCFQDLAVVGDEKYWIPWSALKKVLYEQETVIRTEMEKQGLHLDDKGKILGSPSHSGLEAQEQIKDIHENMRVPDWSGSYGR